MHFEESDILKEVMIFTDRADISEELSRLKSHLQQLERELNSEEAALGKKIEFLLQEIFGINTHSKLIYMKFPIWSFLQKMN